MNKTTQKELRRMVANGLAENVTNWQDVPEAHDKIAFSRGVYGMNGGLYADKDGKRYAIIGRSSNLFRVF